MDIAEIRKKAKAQHQVLAEPFPAAPEPAGAEASAAAVPTSVNAVPQVGAAGALSIVASGLDRLFAAAGTAQFVAEDACQTALVEQKDWQDKGFLQCLAFRLGPEEYALDIARISEIIKPRECTDIPRVPEFILGLISLRGVVVPIIDLRHRFKLGVSQITLESRIIVCREGEITAGLLVDSITQVLRFASDLIEPPPAILSGIDRYLIDGVGRHQGRIVILLNLATVLDVKME
jgi:purine-binding chemotaxis protein CheW